MKKCINLILIFFLPLLLSCKNDKEKTINPQNNASKAMNTEEKLKDGINISASFIDNLEFNKYKYDGDYIENIKVSSFDDTRFSKEFFQFLASRNLDQNQAEQVFFIKLILVRIQQSDDIKSYQILSSIFNDNNLGYYLEDYELFLFQLFLYKPYFFIKGEYHYNQNQIVDYINQNLPAAFLTSKKYFDNNITDAQFPNNALLISQEVVNKFTIKDLKTNIEQDSKLIEISFSPSFETSWKNDEKIYYNIYNYIDNILAKHLDKAEFTLYSVKYKPFFKIYNIKGDNDYTIQDPDGYTNLRKDKNTSSEVLQTIKSGEKIEVLDNAEDWVLIKTNEGKEGYVHKTRIRNN